MFTKRIQHHRRMIFAPSKSICLVFLLCIKLTFIYSNVEAFVPLSHHRSLPFASTASTANSGTSLPMVFDFFKKRAAEGMNQLSNLSDKARQGKLSEGLLDAAAYTSQTNKAFADGLAKSRNKFLYDLEAVFDSTDVYQTLEDVLIQSDIGLTTATEVVSELRSLREDSTKLISRDDLTSVLRGKLIEVLSFPPNDPLQPYSRSIRFEAHDRQGSDLHIPTVLFIMGANGMGKTTTIGKLAHRLKTEGGQKVLLAACDTFRAGAVEQLMLWADRAGVDCYGPPPTTTTTTSTSSTTTNKISSPSAVLYGALDRAVAEKFDTLIVDTSGRLSNNEALTEELMKMKRVIQKRLSVEKTIDIQTGTSTSTPNTHVPHEILLVIDAAQGRMALESARIWNQQLGLTGLVLTKLDGSARGGAVVAVSRELGLPVKLVGVGEKMEDLRDFDAETFVDSLLGIGKAGGKVDGLSKNNEAAVLADRLKELRKLRDERSKSLKLEPSNSIQSSARLSISDDSQSVMAGVKKTTASTVGNKKKQKRK